MLIPNAKFSLKSLYILLNGFRFNIPLLKVPPETHKCKMGFPYPGRWGKTEKPEFTVVNEDFEDAA
jgi:hypothetical protein